MIKHKKTILFLLLAYSLFIVGIYDVRADVLPTGLYGNNITNTDNNYSVWSSSCAPFSDNNSIGACPIDQVKFFGSNPNNYGRFYITNGSSLSNQTISFVLMKNSGYWKVDLTGVYLTDNGVSYSCEIYNTIYSQNSVFYNVICPNLPTLSGNGTSIAYGLRSNEDIQAGQNMSFYINMGLSAINGFANGSTTINDIKNTTNTINTNITDSSIDNNNTSSSTTSWGNKNASNGTITNLLTLPISLLQAIVNGIQSTCSSFSLGSLFGTNITLPCINIGSLIGSGLWSTIDILFSGFMILAIAKKLIKIFNDFTNLNTNQVDELYGGDK